MVTAKFKIDSITNKKWSKQGDTYSIVELSPVTGDTPENKKFFAATPSGSIKLEGIKPECVEQFELGAEVRIAFSIEGVDWKYGEGEEI